MFPFIAGLWDMVLGAGSHVFAFAAMVTIIAIYAFPVLVLVGAVLFWREYRRERLGLGHVDGVRLADAHRYAPQHAWLGRRGHVGIDDLAQRILGPIEKIELPKAGTVLREGDAAAIVTCKGGREVVLTAPAAGTVTAVNHRIEREPHLVADAPYTKGWLYAIRRADTANDRMPTGQAARSWFLGEERRYAGFMEQQFGLAAADGGRFLVPPAELLKDDQWSALVDAFLK